MYLLDQLAEKNGLDPVDLRLKWQECRADVIKKYGREKSGTYEYVRVALEFSERTGISLSEMSL